MITKIFTASTLGLKAQLIEVEIDLTPSLPAVIMVGLPDKAVQESRERIKSALKQSGFEFPIGKVTINLAPADIFKSGSGFDLPIAVGILFLVGYISNSLEGKNIDDDFLQQSLFLGELSLDAQLRPINGCLTICLWAKENGYKNIFIPHGNSHEASLVKGINIYPVSSLLEVVKHIRRENLIQPILPINLSSNSLQSAGFGYNNIHQIKDYWLNNLESDFF